MITYILTYFIKTAKYIVGKINNFIKFRNFTVLYHIEAYSL